MSVRLEVEILDHTLDEIRRVEAAMVEALAAAKAVYSTVESVAAILAEKDKEHECADILQ